MFKMTDEMFENFTSGFVKGQHRRMMMETLFPGLGTVRDNVHYANNGSEYKSLNHLYGTLDGTDIVSVHLIINNIYSYITHPKKFYTALNLVHLNKYVIESALDSINVSDEDRAVIEVFKSTLDKMDNLYQNYRNMIRRYMHGDYIVYGTIDGKAIDPLMDISLMDAIQAIMDIFTESISLPNDIREGGNGMKVANAYVEHASIDPFNDQYETIKQLIIATYDKYHINECELDDFDGPIVFSWTSEDQTHKEHVCELKITCRKNLYHLV